MERKDLRLMRLRRIVAELKALAKVWNHSFDMVSGGVQVMRVDVSGLTVEEINILMAGVGSSAYRLEREGGKVYAVKES
jgi:hypothetical protein